MTEKKQSLLSKIFKPKKSSCCSVEIVEDNDEADSDYENDKKDDQ